MKLNNELFDRTVNLLLEHVHEDNRRSLITPVFRHYRGLYKQIEFSGSDEEFVTKLVDQLDNYGEVEPGKESLVLLLNRLRQKVGYDIQKEIDSLLTELERRQLKNSSNFFTKIISFFGRILTQSDKQSESVPAAKNANSHSSQREKPKQTDCQVEGEQGCISGILNWIGGMIFWGSIVIGVIALVIIGIREALDPVPTPTPPHSMA